MRKQEGMEFTLRPATIDDIAFIYELRVETMKPIFKDTLGWNDAGELKKASGELRYARIVMSDKKRIGVIKVVPESEALHLHQMQILPEFQGRGVGTELIRQTISKAEKLHKTLTLFVVKDTSAQNLYKRFGFVVTDEYRHNCKMSRMIAGNKPEEIL